MSAPSDSMSHESLTGLLRRVADSEGYVSLADFSRRLRMRYGRPMVEHLEDLAAELDVNLDRLQARAPSVRPPDPCYEWRFDRLHSDPFCPTCLHEGLPWRKEWRHALVSTCAIHGVCLQDHCPMCDARITPHSGGLSTCDCGYDLGEISADPGLVTETQFSRALAGNGPSEHTATEIISGTEGISETVWFLACGFVENRTGKNGKARVPQTVTETREFMTPALNLLNDWPINFDRHVSSRWNVGEGQTASQRMGPWYRALMRLKGDLANSLKVRCQQVIREHCGDPYARSEPTSEPDWLSATEAARRLGVRADRLVDTVASGKIEGRQTTTGHGHRHTVIPKKCILEAEQDRDRFLDARETAKRLGVSKSQLSLLRGAGVLRELSLEERPPLVDGGFDWTLIETKVHQIAANSEGMPAPCQTITFNQLTLRRTTDRSALFTLFRQIFDGGIKPVSVAHGDRLGDFSFAATDIEKALESAAETVMTARDVSRVAGWKYECVTHWCAIGLLPASRTQRGSSEIWLIRQKALCEFQATYAVVADLARAMGTSSRAFSAALEAATVETIGAKRVGETSRGRLIRISDLARALSKLTAEGTPAA
ncbi:hypothetical protein BMI85_09785 [Thioclava sp. DLFJ4-1]|nr:hypothetical protein BMI85_09785 [Thioclava sp. DLFJ4-1]